jgi:hypothetical protein
LASELANDGIDQDCSGDDLTIEIIRADYTLPTQRLFVLAATNLDEEAALELTVDLKDSSQIVRTMKWNENSRLWYKGMRKFDDRFGSTPVDVSVSSGGSSISTTVQSR